jgi:hypothetical protein
MDLAMVKQEQGETLHKYMRRFFDKRATVVDVTDKEVIDKMGSSTKVRRPHLTFPCVGADPCSRHRRRLQQRHSTFMSAAA